MVVRMIEIGHKLKSQVDGRWYVKIKSDDSLELDEFMQRVEGLL